MGKRWNELERLVPTVIEKKLVNKKLLKGRKQWYGEEWRGDQESRNEIVKKAY